MANVSSLSAPGVELREYDNSLRITSNTGTTVFVPGYAAQGPVDEVISISSINDFETIYGIPTNAAERYFYYTCLAILNNSGEGKTLLTSRLPYGANDGDNVANAYTLLAYPAIPVAKNSANVKGYDYYSPAASIQNIFSMTTSQDINAKSTIPTVEGEVIIVSDKEVNGAVLKFTEIKPGDIPAVKAVKDDIALCRKSIINWSYGDIEGEAILDIHSEILEDNSAIKLYITSQLVNNDTIIGTISFVLAYTNAAVINAFNKDGVADVTFEAAKYDVEFIKVEAYTQVSRYDGKQTADAAENDDVTYILGAPATFNVSLSEYYQIIAGEYFKWSVECNKFDGSENSFGKNIQETLGNAAFIAINTSRAIINDSYEGYYLGITDNIFNEPSDDYTLNSMRGVKFTSWNRAKLDNSNKIDGIVDSKETENNKFIEISKSRLDFYLDSSNKGSISNIIQTSTSRFDTTTYDYDDTINIGLFKLAKSTVGLGAMKLTYNTTEKYNASLGKSRVFSTSTSITPQNYFVESILESSKNMTVMVNPYIASKIKIDINGNLRGKVRFLSTKLLQNYAKYEKTYIGGRVSDVIAADQDLSKCFKVATNNIKNWATLMSRVGASLNIIKNLAENTTTYKDFNLNDYLYPFATYTVVKKNNKYIGSTPNKIMRVLELIANDEEYPDIDLILEAGLGTIYAYSNNSKNVISEGSSSLIYLEDETTLEGEGGFNNNMFNEDAILQGIEDLRTSRNTLTEDADNVIQDWLAVQDAFQTLANSFQNGGRGDTFYIPDVLRGILIRGKDAKVEKLYGSRLTNNVYSSTETVNHSFATSIYNPIKHTIENLTSSYASIYAQWVKVLDGFTNEKFWVPASGYMAALMCASDQIQGPWYAAAGLNRGIINGVLDCALNPNQKQRGDLYKICVNSVPKLANIGIICWGIRTLSKKASAFDQNTCRRTFLFIEKAIKKLLRYYLFEPNNSYTQLAIYNEIEPYMESIRNQGGIYSFQVVCDASNNTPEIVNSGNLAVDVSAAPTRTAEFIVLNMTANKYTSEVSTSEFNG